MKKIIKIGNVSIGGENPVAIQSMSDLPTTDIDGVVRQAERLKEAGCDIFRVAVRDEADAHAFCEIKKRIDMPLAADIHFSHKTGILAVEAGADKIRINPGNMTHDGVRELLRAVRERGIPIRIGVNSGSIEKKYEKFDRTAALVLSLSDSVRQIEDDGYGKLVLSLKSSSVTETVRAYREADKLFDYPLHIGVTEAGTLASGVVKSAVGLGALLTDGIGDTMRVSLTADPVREVEYAKRILRAVGLDKNYAEVVSCPRCGRCGYDTQTLAELVEERTRFVKKPLKIAVMGCEVNGPGEAKHCDLGIAFGRDKAVLFKKGEVYLTEETEKAVAIFLEEIILLS
ncbi:MAG: flavodoxin-dependent (E)-4-hydroxy-3-methylbut-2-enyl-diphosphate synthase [Clostridiales bacterium]|jgi:(E)-4-hydroxy-3-methylbut-2-enyl-diphosphate synthase|nr:flavodoxin-dependent (E)-4-hydroxy-3-methylbut-2-enyl-diphosphate synthase [Clostridiales bacterium]